MNKLLLIGMVCYGLTAGAQVRQNENFVYLYSDSVIYANRIMLRPDVFNSLQLRADSRRIPLHQVKFFNNADGFFASTRKQTLLSDTEFAERIVEGKINLFQEVSYQPYINDYNYRSIYKRQGTVDVRMYYNKGFENLKKVSYQNLKNDMANNPESMDFLKSYKETIAKRNMLYLGAGVSFLSSILAAVIGVEKNRDTPYFAASIALFCVGSGLSVGGMLVNKTGSAHLESAVDAYNR